MVAPAAAGYTPIGEELRDPQGIYKALLNWFRGQGIDPFQNMYAQRLMTPAKLQQVALLADLEAGGNLEDPQRQDYINRWAQSQWGGGGAGYNRQDIMGRMNAELGRPDSMFRSGDPDADAALMRGYYGIANAGYGERRQATLDRLEAQMGANYGAWRQANPTQGGYYADWRALAQPGSPFTPPTGAPPASAPQSWNPANPNQPAPTYPIPNPWPVGSPNNPTPPVNPALTQYPTPPGPWAGGGPPPRMPTGYGPTPAGAPGPAAGGANPWQALLDRFRPDERNWGTRMYGHPNEGFSIGGVTYNPAQEQAQGAQRYRGMSGQGRETARGSALGVYMYRLQALMKQGMPEAQAAREAAAFVNRHLVGQSPFTVA